MILLPLPCTRRIPDVHWIEYAWMIDEYGPNGEKVSPFWVRLWDGTRGPAMPGLYCDGPVDSGNDVVSEKALQCESSSTIFA